MRIPDRPGGSLKSPCVKHSGRPPIQLYGYASSHPLELRVCSSQTP